MRVRVICMVFCFVVGGVALAQSAAPAKSSVREGLLHASNERMRWEAAQTWNSPAVPPGIEPVHGPIHVEQPPIAPPRIRREWLRPSAKAAQPEATADVADILSGSSAFVRRKAQ